MLKINPFLWFDAPLDGLSWQVIPKALTRYPGDPDRAKADRVVQAMLKMRKIDVVALDRAAAAAA